jgi:hypothetical protein
VGVLLVIGVLVFGYVVLFHVDAAQHLHPVAAITLFVAISLVAFINALTSSAPFKVWYAVSSGGILISVVIVLIFHLTVFYLEILPIGFFTLFWAVQTIELLGRVTRSSAMIPPVLTR